MLYQTLKKNIHTKKQKTGPLFLLITSIVLFVYQQPLAYGQQYVIVDRENGDRLTGAWRGGTETHFEIEYQGEILRLPVKGHRLSFTSDLSNVADRTAAKYFRNGLMLLELGLPEQAKNRFEAAIEEFPKYPNAHYHLGLLYKANGDNTNALERFRSVAILDAVNFELAPHFRELGDAALADAALADAALANEAYREAVENYRLILQYYPDHESVPGLSYITGFLLAEQLVADDEGLSLLESAVKQYPDMLSHEKALFLVGKLQAKTGRLEDALHTLRGFILRYPVSERVYEARLTRVEVNLKLGRVEEAGNEAAEVYDMSVDEAVKERAKQLLDQTRWTVYTVANNLPDNRVQAIAIDGTRLWVGTASGMMLFETDFNNWIPIPDVPQLINSATGTVPDVRAIAVNPDEVWVGTRFQGAVHYDKRTGKIQTYPPIDGFPAWVKDIKMDNSEVWFATDVGVIRKIRGTVNPPIFYNRQQSFIQADNIETLLLTPTTVWGASADGAIVTFNREVEVEEWSLYNSTEMHKGMTVVGFDIAEDQLLFTWFNTDEQSNGYFRADLDGVNGKSTTLHTGITDEIKLRRIYIEGVLDDSPVVVEENEALPVDIPEPLIDEEYQSPAEVTDPLTPESVLETEALEVESQTEVSDIQPPPPPTPLVLWIATNDLFYTHHTRSGEWEDTMTPRIVAGELIIHAFAIGNDRVWIATDKGLAAMNLQ